MADDAVGSTDADSELITSDGDPAGDGADPESTGLAESLGRTDPASELPADSLALAVATAVDDTAEPLGTAELLDDAEAPGGAYFATMSVSRCS